ncbi:FMN-binding protein [Paenibacillus sp. CAA11]|uniref:FMN-binding protein n=1 Tax=Paenibacillus sp. CAA11 TaxID=1532905 RepID=UPI000D3964CF|nr:FMN-binding protein [Paenibacillus sp. CAA11]AWB46522.1 FMN-binding protein [Paenibacillus sp. CAA11]
MNKIAKWTLAAVAAASIALLAACGGSSGQYKDGTYEGTGDGLKHKIKVSVEIKDEKINSIKVLEHKETESMIQAAVDNSIPEIIEKQGTQGIDVVSGASGSSKGVIDAVSDALSKAKK